MHNSRVPALDLQAHPRKQSAGGGRGPVGRLGNQLPHLGPSFPVGRWESNARRPGVGATAGWWGKQTTSSAQQALAQRRSQRSPGPRQSHVGCATGQQGWDPQGLCSLGPYAVTSEPEHPSPKWPAGLTELSCCGLQSQPQLGGRGAFLLPQDTPLAPRQSYLTANGTPTGCPPSADPSIHVSSQPTGVSAGLCDLGQVPGPRGLCPLWSLRTLTREIPRGPRDSGCPSAWRAPGWAGGRSRGRGQAQTFQACPSALRASGLTAASRGLRAPALLRVTATPVSTHSHACLSRWSCSPPTRLQSCVQMYGRGQGKRPAPGRWVEGNNPHSLYIPAPYFLILALLFQNCKW